MKTLRLSSGTKLLAGYLSALGSLLSHAFSASCVQALRGSIPDFQLSFIRSVAQALIYILAGLLCTSDFTVSGENIPGLIYYGAIFLFFNLGFFGAATYLPLGEIQAVVTIVSFIFALAQSKLIFKRDLAKSVIIATFICGAGTVLAVQPPWLFKKVALTLNDATTHVVNASLTQQPMGISTYSADTVGNPVSHSCVICGYTLSVIAGAALGLSFDINSIILCNVKTIPKATYTMISCVIGSVAFMFYLEDPVYVNDLNQCMLVLGHALFSAVTSFLAINAASVVPGPSLSVVFSLDLLTMVASQYTIMHSIQPGNYNWIEVFGCVVVVFGASIPGSVDLLVHKYKSNELP